MKRYLVVMIKGVDADQVINDLKSKGFNVVSHFKILHQLIVEADVDCDCKLMIGGVLSVEEEKTLNSI